MKRELGGRVDSNIIDDSWVYTGPSSSSSSPPSSCSSSSPLHMRGAPLETSRDIQQGRESRWCLGDSVRRRGLTD
eukprot:9143489-Pyramimonas_sp.AAC.1